MMIIFPTLSIKTSLVYIYLYIPWPGLTPGRGVIVWCTLLTSCLLNLVGEGGPSYLRRSCLCPMGAATGMDSAHLLLAFGW